MSQYVSDFKNWDLAIITLEEPVGLKAGWMGIKALPPKGACTPGALSLPRLHSVGYPVESVSSAFQYTSTCSLEVRPQPPCEKTVSTSSQRKPVDASDEACPHELCFLARHAAVHPLHAE